MARITSFSPIPDSGIDPETAKTIFEQINRFAGYGFNKSHAAAYAAISYQTAWLKTHYPECFFSAAMNLDLDNVDGIAEFVDTMASRRIPLRSPSINTSMARFTPHALSTPSKGRTHAIHYGLAAIRGVGLSAATAIEAERVARGPFATFSDFSDRMNGAVNRTALQGLARAGAFDDLGLTRTMALAHAQERAASAGSAQMSMFETMGADIAPTMPDLTDDEVLDNELSALGFYMSGHPLDTIGRGFEFRDSVRARVDSAYTARMAAIPTRIDSKRTRSGNIMGVVTMSDPDGLYEAIAYEDTWNRIRKIVRKGARLSLRVAARRSDDDVRFIIDDATVMQADHPVAA